MNTTRQHTGEGVQHLLDAFNAICSELAAFADLAQGRTHRVHDIDALLATSGPAVERLTAAAGQGLELAQQTQARLVNCAELAQRHRQLSSQLRAIARHTRLVAFNAAIEGRRGGAAVNAGISTIAEEVKLVSSQMEDAADTGDQLSHALELATAHARAQATLAEGSHCGMHQELEARVREAITSILQGVGAAGQGGGAGSSQAAHLRSQIDDIYVQFQFGDRVSQMIELISTNMSSFVQWVSAHPHPTQADVDQWLKDLEMSYSMDEQRACHHGNVHVDASKGIEFF